MKGLATAFPQNGTMTLWLAGAPSSTTLAVAATRTTLTLRESVSLCVATSHSQQVLDVCLHMERLAFLGVEGEPTFYLALLREGVMGVKCILAVGTVALPAQVR